MSYFSYINNYIRQKFYKRHMYKYLYMHNSILKYTSFQEFNRNIFI